jgi:hypothetical protein
VGGAYARILEGGLLVVSRGHEGRLVKRGWNGDIGGSRESQTIYRTGQGQKKVPGPKKLIFDFSKGFLYRAMIKFEADPVVGYRQREAGSDGESALSPSI